MKRLATLAGLALAALLGSFALSAPANATPTCTAYTDSAGTFPADSAGHEQICFAATTADKTTIATAVRALPRKGTSGPLQAYDQVKAAGTTIFFFNTRADAVDYFTNTAPYSGISNYATKAGSGRCGFTWSQAGAGLVSAVYKTCQYDGITSPSSGTNPDLDHTVKHEMGHAFDVAMVLAGVQTYQPSSSTGFGTSVSPPNYIQDGLNNLTPANWSTMSTADKNATVCNIYSTVKFSPLERSLIVGKGGTDPDPSNVGKSVCVTSGATLVPDTPYVGKTPTQIAQIIAPYFVTDVTEAWAEIFARNVGVTVPPSPGFLQLTDKIFITPRFNCANMDVSDYSTTSLPPTSGDISAHSCSFTPFQL